MDKFLASKPSDRVVSTPQRGHTKLLLGSIYLL